MSIENVLGPGGPRGYKFLLVAVLTLASLIPLMLVDSVVDERADRNEATRSEIARVWGGEQSVGGPFLIVPFLEGGAAEAGVAETDLPRGVRRHLIVSPDVLMANVEMTTETRQRGIYEVPVYRAQVVLTGEFGLPPSEAFGRGQIRVLRDEAWLDFRVNALRGLRDVSLVWMGEAVETEALPGSDGERESVVLRSAAPVNHEAPWRFQANIAINGTERIGILPAGATSHVTFTGDWPDPAFGGAFLPETRGVGETGFSATWEVSRFAAAVPRFRRGADAFASLPDDLAVSVTLFEPVDLYQQVERAIKYGLLFISLTFLTFFVFEALSDVRIHFVQYLFVGLALTMFFLTLLSLSEHVDFAIAYLVSTAISVGMVGTYALSVLGHWSRALVIAGVLSALYAVIYSLLISEDFALLYGTLVLLAALGATMFLTRNVDWFVKSDEGREGDGIVLDQI